MLLRKYSKLTNISAKIYSTFAENGVALKCRRSITNNQRIIMCKTYVDICYFAIAYICYMYYVKFI